MKNLRNYLFQTLLIVVAVLALQSCNTSVTDRIDKVASDNNDLVIAGDLHRLLDALDVDVKDGRIQIPDYLQNLVEKGGRRAEREFDEGIDMMSQFDFTSAVAAFKFKENGTSAVISFDIRDVDAFYAKINSMEEDVTKGEISGYTTIGDDKTTILVDRHTAYFVVKNNEPLFGTIAVNELEKWFDEAKDNPLAGWKRDYLVKEAVVSAWGTPIALKQVDPYEWRQLEKMLKAVPGFSLDNISAGMRLDLDDDTMKGNLTVFDGEKVMKSPVGGQIDSDLLRYTIDTDVFAAIISLNSTTMGLITQQIDAFTQTGFYPYGSQISDLVGSLDGSAMMAYGYQDTDNLHAIYNDMEKYGHFVVAVKCKNGKGSSIMDTFASLGRENLNSVTPIKNGFILTEGDTKLYVMLDEGNVVISNTEITTSGGRNFDKSLFDDCWFAAQLNVPTDQPVLKRYNMTFGVTASLKAEDLSIDAEMAFPGSKENFVPTIVNIINGVAAGMMQ